MLRDDVSRAPRSICERLLEGAVRLAYPQMCVATLWETDLRDALAAHTVWGQTPSGL